MLGTLSILRSCRHSMVAQWGVGLVQDLMAGNFPSSGTESEVELQSLPLHGLIPVLTFSQPMNN